MNRLHQISNALVAAVALGVAVYLGWDKATEFVSAAPAQTVAYAGFGSLFAGIVGVGSALLSPRRF